MAIALDTTSNGATTGTSLTFSHTCSGSNKILFVGVGQENSTDVISGVTYNSVSMTAIDTQINGGPNEVLSLYYLINPSTGSNNVVISLGSSIDVRGVSISYTGALQSGVPDSKNKATNTASTSITTSVITVLNNCWVVGIAQLDSGVPAASTGVTSRVVQNNIRMGDSDAVITPAGSYSMTWTGSSGRFNTVMASFAPAPSSSGMFLLF